MNEAQRMTLQRHYKQLSSDIIITDDLIGNLYQMKIFEWSMIEMIKAQTTRTDQVQKMLELLPKRGPRAFDGFVEAIQNDYPWLASLLESSYDALKTQNNAHHKATIRQDTARSLVFDTHFTVEPDTKKMVGAFVHRQFGTSKRISQNDKKALEKWLNEQLNDQRKRLQSVTDLPESIADSETESHDSNYVDIQQQLYSVHCQLEAYLVKDRQYKIMQHVPDDMTFEIISEELEVVLKVIDSLEKQLQLSTDHFDVKQRHRPLPDLVQSLVATCQQQKETLNKETKRVTELLKELNEYSEHIDTVEYERMIYRNRSECCQKEVLQLQDQNDSLQEKCRTLEKAHRQHLEKEKTLENLKKVIAELEACQTFHARDVSGSVDWYNQRSRKTVRVSTDRTQKSPVRTSFALQMSNRRMAANKTIPKRRNSYYSKPGS